VGRGILSFAEEEEDWVWV